MNKTLNDCEDSHTQLHTSETSWNRKLWIYDLRTNMNFMLKTNPLMREDLNEFVKCYNPENRHTSKETWSDKTPVGRWRAYSYDEQIDREKVSLETSD